MGSDPSAARAAPSSPPIPARLGRFRVEHLLGRGGLGVVYAGVDPELDRRVALKVVRADVLARRRDGRARLVREARTLARLGHPNVVRIYDVGYVDERNPDAGVFIAMELVEGRTLREWLHGAPRTWREIVAVFLAAGRGLAGVHAAGFVHRDFKPSNVLIGDSTSSGADAGRVLLADFGLVRAIGRPNHDDGGSTGPHGSSSSSDDEILDPLTRIGTLVGTPHYMAPEQRAGTRARPASDQYSFCIALTEALWGTGVRARDDVAHRPSMPGARDGGRVPRRVRMALRRGLAVAPDDRFASMTALLSELEEALHTKRRSPLAYALVGAGLMTGGVAIFTAAMPASTRCDDGLTRRDRLWGAARQEEIHEALAPTLPPGGETWPRLRDVLDDKAGAWADALTETCAALDSPALGPQAEARVACLDTIYAELEGIVLALERPGPQTWVRALQAAHGIDPATTCLDDSGPVSPEPPIRELVHLRALVDVGHHHEAHTAALQLVRERPGDARVQASAEFVLGLAASSDGNNAEAEQHFVRAYWLAVEHEDAPWATRIAAETAIWLLRVSWIESRFDDAETWRRHAGAAVARAVAVPELEDELVLEVAALERHLGRLETSERLVQDVLDRVGGRPGSEKQWRRALGMQIELLNARGGYDVALETAETSLAVARDTFGDEHPATAMAHYHIAMCHDYAGRKEQALAALREALRIEEAAFGPAHVQVARTTAQVGNALQGMGRADEAVLHLERAMAATEAIYGPRHRETAEIVGLLATNALARGDLEDADALSSRELEILVESLPPRSEQLLVAKGARAELLLLRKRYADAELLASEAIAGARVLAGRYGSLELELLNVLLRAWLEQGRATEVLAETTSALAAIRARGETATRDAALMLWFQGQAHLQLGAPQDAARVLLAATEAIDHGGIDQPFLSGAVQVKLATALARSGQPAMARKAADLAEATYRASDDEAGLAEVALVRAELGRAR